MKNLIALLTITMTLPFALHASDVEILGNVKIADDPETTAKEGNLRVNGSLTVGDFTGTVASGVASFASGRNARAYGDYSTAKGDGSRADGLHSVAIGVGSYAGLEDPASGVAPRYAFAYGRASARGEYSLAFGMWTNAMANYSIALGSNTNVKGSPAFGFGHACVADNHMSLAIGNTAKSLHNYATSIGQFTEASGYKSVAMGSHTVASGWGAVAYGYENIASGYGASAFGWKNNALANYSVAVGYGSTTTGYTAFTFGTYLTSDTFRQMTLGLWNEKIEGNPDAWVDTDPFFVIGNGKSAAARANALVMQKNGDTKLAGRFEAKSIKTREASGGIPMGNFGR